MANRRRATISVGLIAAGVILAVLAAWSYSYRYFTHDTNQWRIWVAAAGCFLIVTGVCLVIARRRSQRRAETFFGEAISGEVTGAARQDAPAPSPPRDWAALAAALPGIAALVALIFTAFTVQQSQGQLKATQQQLAITEKGQVTDRYNAAITNLGSGSVDMRLGGIYALQRLMQDTSSEQPTIIAVLCAFARDQSAMDAKPGGSAGGPAAPQTDVQAALTVIGNRDTASDAHVTIIDLDHALLPTAALQSLRLAYANLADADLAGANLTDAQLGAAKLIGANLTSANLSATDLDNANLTGANLTSVQLTNADLRNANLSGANFTGATFSNVSLDGASFFSANLTKAVLAGEILPGLVFATANLTGTDFSGSTLTNGYLVAAELADGKFANAHLEGSDLTGADLPRADLRSAHLSGANLSYANLTRVTGDAANLAGANLTDANLSGAHFDGYAADFTGANLTGANLTGAFLVHANLAGARLAGANLTGADLTDAYWPQGVAAPGGWQRNPRSGRLERTGR
jgi:uncharacterized protein YjbI with pentapeptide repeats